MSIQVCFIALININYSENGGRKAFLSNPKHQYRVSKYEEQNCRAHNEENGDYNENSGLSYFTNKH